VLTARLYLVNYPTVFYSQDITSTTTLPLSILNKTLYAFIGHEALLLLPNVIGVEYTVLSNKLLVASVSSNALTVISMSEEDIGTHSL
jgi:hypothetical protein